MIRISWKTALAFSLALGLSLADQTINRTANAATPSVEPQKGGGGGQKGGGQRGGGGGQKGGGGQGGGGQGGGGGQKGGGAAPRGGGGPTQGGQRQAPGTSRAPGLQRAPGTQRAPGRQSNPGRRAIHVPPSNITRQAPSRSGQTPGRIRTPAPSRPRIQNSAPQEGVAKRSPVRGPGNTSNAKAQKGNPANIGNRPPITANPRQPGVDRPKLGDNQGRGNTNVVDRNKTNQPRVGDATRNLSDTNRPNIRDGRQTVNRRGDNNISRNDQRTRTDVNTNTNTNTNNNVNLNRTTRQYNNNNYSRINSRDFDGNHVNYNNRRWNVGSNDYRPSYYRHDRYHGYWNNNRGYGNNWNSGGFGNNWGYGGYGSGWGLGLGNNNFGYGNRSYGGYGYRPLRWGLGGWGLGSLLYNSGYLRYSNPYYVSSESSIYNYSQPIPVVYTSTVATESSDTVTTDSVYSAEEVLDDAVAEFQQNNYDAALDITNKGISQYPDDAVLHEFRSLVLFARQDYQQSAATIHSVLAVGPGWDWTTMSSIYSDVSLYTQQLRALESFTRSNPQDAASRLLLGYHYMTCGHKDAAAGQLEQVVRLNPEDSVSADLLRMLAPPTPEEPASGTADAAAIAETQVARETPTVDPAMLTGVWKATREDGSVFNLTLTDDSKFVWSFVGENQTSEEFGGTYSLEGNVLALEREKGGALIAEVSPDGDGRFGFRIVGAPESDPGLQFVR